jgi:hypothetical protein
VPDSERVDAGATDRGARESSRRGEQLAYGAVGLSCAAYLNARTRLVPTLGEWYPADTHPAVLLQLRAWFSGKLAPTPHPVGDWYDYVWGRGGMHSNFGLGVPILAIPFHAVARVFGAPGFPDHVRFLIFYAVTVALFTRALHRTSRVEPTALVASAAASSFLLLFPTFVGLIAARFLIYEQTIAVGALWSVLLLGGILVLLERATTPRFVLVCGAAGFSIFIRAPLAAYGLTTLALATVIALRGGVPRRGLVAGVATGVFVTGLYLVANFVRFGSPFDAGYANIVSMAFVNHLTRWGVSFAATPLPMAAKELFATLFLLDPVASPIITVVPASVPAPVAPYAVGQRWREYSSPTFDLWIFGAWVAAFALVAWRVVSRRLWRRDRDLGDQVSTVVGLWALPPSIALFVFYARVGNFATRYVVDLYPAYAAAVICMGMAVVDEVRKRAPRGVAAARLTIAVVGWIYLSGGDGWPHRREGPVNRDALDAQLAAIDALSRDQPIPSAHIGCGDPRGPEPVYGHFAGWLDDCSAPSGMVFALPRSPCLTFAFQPGRRGRWGAAEDESLAGFRANGDFDALVSCGPATGEGETRSITMCEPHSPRFLLDGMRLYAVAWLDANRRAIDRLKLMRIDPAPTCP